MTEGQGEGPKLVTKSDKPEGNVRSLGDQKKKIAENYASPVARLLENGEYDVPFLTPWTIPEQSVALVTGESGAGKSWIVYELARAVATGTSWLHRGLMAKQGPVVILNHDQPTNTLISRLKSMGFQSDWPVYVHTLGYTTPCNGKGEMLTLPECHKEIKILLQELQPALTIVDSMRQLHTEDENDNSKMRTLMSELKSWTRIGSNTIALVHHTAKSDNASWAGKARGSGEIFASAGVEIFVSDGILKWTKHQAWEIGTTDQCSFKLTTECSNNNVDDDQVFVRTCVKATSVLPGEVDLLLKAKVFDVLRAHPNHGVSFKELSEKCKIPLAKLMVMLNDARLRKTIISREVDHERHFFVNDSE